MIRDLETAVQGQFFHDIMHMAFDRESSDIQLVRDFLVALRIHNQGYDFLFAFRHPDGRCHAGYGSDAAGQRPG